MLKELFYCLSDVVNSEHFAKECARLSAGILVSLSMSKDVSIALLRQHEILLHILPWIDMKGLCDDAKHEEAVRNAAISVLNNNIQQMIDEDIAILKSQNVYDRLKKALTTSIDQNIPTRTFANNILQWYERKEAERVEKEHRKALVGGRWVAPMECTLLRLKIPIELRRMIKRYLYSPLNDVLLSSSVKTWQFADPLNVYRLYGHISEWNTSKITTMWQLFHRTNFTTTSSTDSNFNEDIELWDVSNVKSMRGMFDGAKSFNKPLNGWCVDKVESMAMMFQGATCFNQPLDAWNVRYVKTFENMFTGAHAFNQPLHMWENSIGKDADKLGIMSG